MPTRPRSPPSCPGSYLTCPCLVMGGKQETLGHRPGLPARTQGSPHLTPSPDVTVAPLRPLGTQDLSSSSVAARRKERDAVGTSAALETLSWPRGWTTLEI